MPCRAIGPIRLRGFCKCGLRLRETTVLMLSSTMHKTLDLLWRSGRGVLVREARKIVRVIIFPLRQIDRCGKKVWDEDKH